MLSTSLLVLLLIAGASVIAFAHTKEYKAGFKEGYTGGDPLINGQLGTPTDPKGIEHYNAGYEAGVKASTPYSNCEHFDTCGDPKYNAGIQPQVASETPKKIVKLSEPDSGDHQGRISDSNIIQTSLMSIQINPFNTAAAFSNLTFYLNSTDSHYHLKGWFQNTLPEAVDTKSISLSFEDKTTHVQLGTGNSVFVSRPVDSGATVAFDIDTGYGQDQFEQIQHMQALLTYA